MINDGTAKYHVVTDEITAIFRALPAIPLELKAPLKICGNINGRYTDLSRLSGLTKSNTREVLSAPWESCMSQYQPTNTKRIGRSVRQTGTAL